MTQQECKKCKGRYKTLVNGICANCDPELHRSHFSKMYDKRRKNK